MAPGLPPGFLLTDRAPEAVLFRLAGHTVTAGRFAADALRLADQLDGAGPVLNLCTRRYYFAVGIAAALLRGRPSLLSSDRSPERLRALAASHAAAVALVDDGAEAADSPVPAIAVPPPGTQVAAIPSVPADQLAALVFTSGSTGEAVAHPKRWGELAERSRAAALAWSLQAEAPSSIVGTVPPRHMYGFELTVLMPLHAPCAAWCGPAFFPADIRAALEALPAPRLLVTTPLQLRTLLESGAVLPPLQAVISATAPLEAEMALAAEARWGAPVCEVFGATEVGSIARRRTADGPGWTPYPGLALEAGEDGLVVRAPFAAETVLDDRVAAMPDGRFRLLGRRQDVVKLGGRRASLAGLNRALAGVAGVQDGVFVPPAPDLDHASARMTVVVVAPGAAAEAILAGLRERIDPAFLPRRIVHVDRLPRNELGKLPAAALQALAQ